MLGVVLVIRDRDSYLGCFIVSSEARCIPLPTLLSFVSHGRPHPPDAHSPGLRLDEYLLHPRGCCPSFLPLPWAARPLNMNGVWTEAPSPSSSWQTFFEWVVIPEGRGNPLPQLPGFEPSWDALWHQGQGSGVGWLAALRLPAFEKPSLP